MGCGKWQIEALLCIDTIDYIAKAILNLNLIRTIPTRFCIKREHFYAPFLLGGGQLSGVGFDLLVHRLDPVQ